MRLESVSIERVREWSYRDTVIPQTGLSSTLGLKKRPTLQYLSAKVN